VPTPACRAPRPLGRLRPVSGLVGGPPRALCGSPSRQARRRTTWPRSGLLDPLPTYRCGGSAGLAAQQRLHRSSRWYPRLHAGHL